VECVKKVCFGAVAAFVISLMFSAHARALTTINFDPQDTPGDLPSGLSAMGNSPGGTVPTSAELSNQYDSDGVLFSSTSPFVAVVDIGGGVASPPNAIGGVTSDGLLSYADPVTFTFVVPGTTTPGVTTNVSITADDSGISGQFATLSAFDINGHLLDSQTLNDIGGETWNIDLAGIHSAVFDFPTTSTGGPATTSAFGNGTGIALDNLTFGTVGATTSVGPSPVPLPPAGWSALFLLGALAILRLLRQRIAISGR
jgi:hypothetical protein